MALDGADGRRVGVALGGEDVVELLRGVAGTGTGTEKRAARGLRAAFSGLIHRTIPASHRHLYGWRGGLP